jgi:ferredoxin
MKIEIDKDICVRCGGCVSVCPLAALELTDIVRCDDKKCAKCKTCVRFCPMGAIALK